jgi:hypothetical protein
MFKSLLLIAPLALAGVANAQPVHLTDAQYLAAVRCQTLMSSSNLGREDTRAIDSLVKSEASTRSGPAYDRGESVREDTAQTARHAGAFAKAALTTERDGLCRAFTGVVQSASVTTPAANRTN